VPVNKPNRGMWSQVCEVEKPLFHAVDPVLRQNGIRFVLLHIGFYML
jgi:hypothetical protein